MNSISNRVILLIIGLILAPYFLWAGIELSDWWGTLSTKDRSNQVLRFCVWEFCVVIFSCGAVVFIHLLNSVRVGERLASTSEALESVAGLVCFIFIFGVVRSGQGLAGWLLHPFGFLLIIGITPFVFVVKDVLVDIFSEPDVKEEIPAKGDKKR